MNIEQIKEKLHAMVPPYAKQLAPVYKLLDWKWQPPGTSPHVPSAEEIEKSLNESIERLDEKYNNCGGGGVEVFYELPNEETGEGGSYGLRFVFDVQEFFN